MQNPACRLAGRVFFAFLKAEEQLMGIGQPWVCGNEGREALRFKEAYGVFLSSNGQVGYAVGLGAALASCSS